MKEPSPAAFTIKTNRAETECTLRCERCGRKLRVPLPLPVNDYAEALIEFSEKHLTCSKKRVVLGCFLADVLWCLCRGDWKR